MELSDVTAALDPSATTNRAAAANEEEEEEDAAAVAVDDDHADAKMALSYSDPTKVKFTNSNSVQQEYNGHDAKVDIENIQVAFAGMGKEELMKYANDPFWVRLRWTFFVLFWIVWISMLVGAIVIVVMTPGCPPLPARDWSQKTVIYQVYPRSFMDSNGDGIGDLKGIESKLDHFVNLGVNTIWLSPFYKSPMADFGYDISDFKDVDPIFGNMEDFKSLMNSSRSRGLKIVLDFVPNHSSNQHVWFQKSRAREENYTDYYIWRDGTGPNKRDPPNNWVSIFNGPAWTYDDVRGQFYFHQFLSAQPDLNYRNPKVREEMKNVLRYWLDLGVAGFRVDALAFLFEREDLKDEPLSNTTAKSDEYGYLLHEYTQGQPETFDVNREWRSVLNEYEDKDGEHRFMAVEVYDSLPKTMRYYGNSTRDLNDFPFNFELIPLNNQTTASDLHRIVTKYLAAVPADRWPNWVLGNHDQHRISSRTHPSLVDGFNALAMLLGGTPITYYGEEIGMHDVPISFDESLDPVGRWHGEANYLPFSRDFERTPMQWSAEPNAGFTTAEAKPWLPIADDYQTNNVKVQSDDPYSHLNVYKKLVKLREEQAIVYGDRCLVLGDDPATNVFSFARVKKGSPGYVVVMNLGSAATVVDLKASEACSDIFSFPDDGIIEVGGHRKAGGATNNGHSSEHGAGEAKTSKPPASKIKVQLNAVHLGPRESLVVKFVPNIKVKS